MRPEQDESPRPGRIPITDELVRLYHARLFAYCRTLTKNYFLIPDLVQETWVRAVRFGLPLEVEEAGRFPWLMHVARNTFHRFLHRSRREQQVILPTEPNDPVALEPGPAERVEHEDMLKRSAELVVKMPPKYRLVLALRYDNGHTVKQAAILLGVKRWHRRALVCLRNALTPS